MTGRGLFITGAVLVAAGVIIGVWGSHYHPRTGWGGLGGLLILVGAYGFMATGLTKREERP
jgi:hypothetical protein